MWLAAETTPPLKAREATVGLSQPTEWREAAEAFRSSQEQGGVREAPTERDTVLVLQGAPPTVGLASAGIG